MTKKTMMATALAVAGVFAVEAKVKMGVPFTDGMVLQRDRAVPVWGTADAGEKVKVAFAGQTRETTADAQGAWRVNLAPLAASCEGRTLTANDVAVKDVLVGEVWFCAGQSNTEVPLWGGNSHFRDGKGAMRARMTHKPLVRYCYQSNYRLSVTPKKTAPRPVEWKPFTPNNLMQGSSFSAMGVYFALEVHNALGIPVGIVGTYWGGTRIEPWTPASGFAAVPALKHLADSKLVDAAAAEEMKKAGKTPPTLSQQERVLWNEMVNPWTPFAVRGLIWYQGCSNAGEGLAYADKMHALYRGWAKEFENPGFRLYFVQLAPWGFEGIAKIQEGQAKFAAEEKNAGMAVINDVGNLHDIHPNDKETVGQRLALFALNRDYGFADVRADSPTLRSWKVEGDRFVLSFDHAEGWYYYTPDGSPVNGFEIAGPDGRFVAAKLVNAKKGRGLIEGRDLIVSAPGVTEPRKLRYLYSRPWTGTVYSDAALPLGAFHIGD